MICRAVHLIGLGVFKEQFMVGVCIKYFHKNYGGMLQAYATVKMLEQRGIDYELVQYEKHFSAVQKIRFVPRLLNKVLLNDKKENFEKEISKRKHPEFAKNDAVRAKEFDKFKEAHFTKLSPVFKGYGDLCHGAERYTAVVTGSDQLWSPAGLPTNYYNLMFVPDNIRKISYASSFGVSEIPWYQKKRTAEFLNRIEFISMRENRGSEIVKELTGRDVPTILDPVFSFDKAGWEEIIPVKKEIEEPYIFAYFLGADKEHRNAVNELAKKTGLKIVALRHLDQYVETDENFGDFAPYDVAPDRFLNFIRHADYVCTDSFHGSCFSIIHHKKFLIFNRYSNNTSVSKNSRIDSLCANLNLESRRFDGDVNKITDSIDYDAVEARLQVLKDSTNEYIDAAFKGIS